MQRAQRQLSRSKAYSRPTAPLRRPGAVRSGGGAGIRRGQSAHPLAHAHENARLFDYEQGVKAAFDNIVPTLKRISALQHEMDFERQAQAIAREQLGFELPETVLAGAWVEQLDMRKLFAWCVFTTYRKFCDEFFSRDPLAAESVEDFQNFLQECGFHTLDISPCADGRLAHVIRYVLRLPHRAVRRKSYAGAMFDVDDSIQKWVETEMLRYREGRPNTADAPTRYLKAVVYHYSSVAPHKEGCAAHGSDTQKAALAGLDRLEAFQQAIENSFCCGASIDLLLIGLDTDTDAIRVHIPDAQGELELDRFVDGLDLYQRTQRLSQTDAQRAVEDAVVGEAADIETGMLQLVKRLLENNMSQIDYVRSYHGSHYADIGHAERFIGAGIGFEDVQLRNLMFFAYLDTVEEATQDLDVGIKIFTGLNVAHGLPVPVVVRYDYHSQVPGSRERAREHCARVAGALKARYRHLVDRGLLHTLLVIRDCTENAGLEVLGCSVRDELPQGAH